MISISVQCGLVACDVQPRRGEGVRSRGQLPLDDHLRQADRDGRLQSGAAEGCRSLRRQRPVAADSGNPGDGQLPLHRPLQRHHVSPHRRIPGRSGGLALGSRLKLSPLSYTTGNGGRGV